MAVLVIMGVILSSLIPGWIDRINRANYEKMINEMTTIAQASIDYYNSQHPNVWPTGISDLTSTYMYIKTEPLNPWGRSYVLTTPNSSNNYKNLVQVSTAIPPGIVQMNPEGQMVTVVPGVANNDGQVSIVLSAPDEGRGWLQYENN